MQHRLTLNTHPRICPTGGNIRSGIVPAPPVEEKLEQALPGAVIAFEAHYVVHDFEHKLEHFAPAVLIAVSGLLAQADSQLGADVFKLGLMCVPEVTEAFNTFSRPYSCKNLCFLTCMPLSAVSQSLKTLVYDLAAAYRGQSFAACKSTSFDCKWR
jgi:hypothetical protein